ISCKCLCCLIGLVFWTEAISSAQPKDARTPPKETDLLSELTLKETIWAQSCKKPMSYNRFGSMPNRDSAPQFALRDFPDLLKQATVIPTLGFHRPPPLAQGVAATEGRRLIFWDMLSRTRFEFWETNESTVVEFGEQIRIASPIWTEPSGHIRIP